MQVTDEDPMESEALSSKENSTISRLSETCPLFSDHQEDIRADLAAQAVNQNAFRG